MSSPFLRRLDTAALVVAALSAAPQLSAQRPASRSTVADTTRSTGIDTVKVIGRIDDLDAKVEMYVRCLTRDAAAGPFTDRDPVLGRQLYKGRVV